jgi:hypothetical protein
MEQVMTFTEWLDRKKLNLIAKKANLDISKFDIHQVADGYKVELEHGTKNMATNVTNDDPVKTLKIAVAHLQEDPHYYTKLKKVEGD